MTPHTIPVFLTSNQLQNPQVSFIPSGACISFALQLFVVLSSRFGRFAFSPARWAEASDTLYALSTQSRRREPIERCCNGVTEFVKLICGVTARHRGMTPLLAPPATAT